MRLPLLLSLALSIALAGCMMIDAISPQVRFSDQVHQLNDEVRWGRIDLAAQRVDGPYRRDFVQRHRAWGAAIQMADVEVTNLDLGLPDDGAASFVRYAWYDQLTMRVESTTVRQIWRSSGETFVLTGEEVIDGNPALLPGAPVIDLDAIDDHGDISAGGEDTALDETAHAEPTPPRSSSSGQVRDPQGTRLQ